MIPGQPPPEMPAELDLHGAYMRTADAARLVSVFLFGERGRQFRAGHDALAAMDAVVDRVVGVRGFLEASLRARKLELLDAMHAERFGASPARGAPPGTLDDPGGYGFSRPPDGDVAGGPLPPDVDGYAPGGRGEPS